MLDVISAPKPKQTKGRMKIAIKKIQNKNKKHVTFSKRRNGLFKKSTELCVLCGANVAVITFSEAGKVFTFGHPSTNAVIHHYLHTGDGAGASQAKAATGNQLGFWWDRPVEELGLEELESYAAALEQLKSNVERRITDLENQLKLNDSAVLKSDFDFDYEYEHRPAPIPIQAAGIAPGMMSNQMNDYYNLNNNGSSSMDPAILALACRI